MANYQQQVATELDRQQNGYNPKKDSPHDAEHEPQFSLRPASTKTSSSKPTSRPSSPVSFPKITNKTLTVAKESPDLKHDEEAPSKNVTKGSFLNKKMRIFINQVQAEYSEKLILFSFV